MVLCHVTSLEGSLIINSPTVGPAVIRPKDTKDIDRVIALFDTVSGQAQGERREFTEEKTEAEKAAAKPKTGAANDPVDIAENMPIVNIILTFHSLVILLLLVPVIALNIPFIILFLGVIALALEFLVKEHDSFFGNWRCPILPADFPDICGFADIGNTKEILSLVFFAPVWTISAAILAAWIGMGMLVSVALVILVSVAAVPALVAYACNVPAATAIRAAWDAIETATYLIQSPFLAMIKAHRIFWIAVGYPDNARTLDINPQINLGWKWYGLMCVGASACERQAECEAWRDVRRDAAQR